MLPCLDLSERSFAALTTTSSLTAGFGIRPGELKFQFSRPDTGLVSQFYPSEPGFATCVPSLPVPSWRPTLLCNRLP